MRSRSLIIAVISLVVLMAIAFLSGTIAFATGREIVVASDLYTVSTEVTDIRRWGNWYPGFRDTSQFLVTASSPTAIVVKFESAGKAAYESFSLTPSVDGHSTTVRWTRSLTALGWLGEQGPGGKMEEGLEHLKQYIEDPAAYYGFSIGIGPVIDTLILTDTKTVRRHEVQAARLTILNRLRVVASRHHILADAAYAYSSYRDIGADSVEVAAGLPVRARVNETGSARFLELPAGGRLLVGRYKGRYADMTILYKVMNKYIVDRGLKKVAAPLEQYAEGSGAFALLFPIY